MEENSKTHSYFMSSGDEAACMVSLIFPLQSWQVLFNLFSFLSFIEELWLVTWVTNGRKNSYSCLNTISSTGSKTLPFLALFTPTEDIHL